MGAGNGPVTTAGGLIGWAGARWALFVSVAGIAVEVGCGMKWRLRKLPDGSGLGACVGKVT